MVEHRRYKRAPVDLALEFVHPTTQERTVGRATDMSIGGMFVQTTNPAAFGLQVTLTVTFPEERRPIELPAIVRWTRPGQGMGVQFGLLGARETHAIMEATHHATKVTGV